MLFQPDLFSDSRPGWRQLDSKLAPVLDEVLSQLSPNFERLQCTPEQSNALGINSTNFRIKTDDGDFVLKRWSHDAHSLDVCRTLDIMNWLASQQLPVPAPVKVQQDSFIHSTDSGTWSLFPFVQGEYFSGAGDELFAAAEITGRLIEKLALLPAYCTPNVGPTQLSKADSELIRRAKDMSSKWDKLFGDENAALLNLSWPLLMFEWEKLKSTKLMVGRIQPAHIDLHPHNLLVDADKVVAVLDFESCKVMPFGFALGFAALKQCRQTMALSTSLREPRFVGSLYKNHLLKACPSAHELLAHLGDLAVAECLRRICVIFRLILEERDEKWNRVLGVQIGHLSEARMLFG